MTRPRQAWLVAALAAALTALVGSVLAVTTWGTGAGPYGERGAFRFQGGPGRGFPDTACTPSRGTGTNVTFTAWDMGMGGWMMGGSFTGPMGFVPRAATVPAGPVTLTLDNAGSRPHELVVLPLAPGQRAGNRTVGPGDRVDETGALGEVDPVCPPGSGGDGTVPGGVSQVTLTLVAGRYEVVCNLPGHYGSGMFATLTVT